MQYVRLSGVVTKILVRVIVANIFRSCRSTGSDYVLFNVYALVIELKSKGSLAPHIWCFANGAERLEKRNMY